MYILHNLRYRSEAVNWHDYGGKRITGWMPRTFDNDRILVCDLGFNVEEDALIYKLKFHNCFVPNTLTE